MTDLRERIARIVDVHAFDADRWSCGCGWGAVEEWTDLERLRAHRLHVAEVLIELLPSDGWGAAEAKAADPERKAMVAEVLESIDWLGER